MNDAASPRLLARLAPWAATLAIAVLLFARLSRFGIWDPSEIEIADQGRRLAEGQQVTIAHWGPWLVSRGFALFGIHEWTGRVPIALGGLAVALLSYALTRYFADRRAALYALIVAGTSPMLLLNARTMLGEAPSLALQASIVLCGCLALYGGRGLRASGRAGWLVTTVVLCVFAVAARGALLGAAPALVALAGLGLLDGKLRDGADGFGRAAASVLCAGAVVVCAQITMHAFADRAGFDVWLGGQPAGGETPGFDAVFERVFHAFAPWSALLPLALAQLPKTPLALEDADARRERRLRVLVLLWLGASYVALSLFLSRYGRSAATMPVTALAAGVALFMREVERTKAGHWPAALGAALLASLLVRDYALYPESPLQALPLAEFKLPEVFNPSNLWAVELFTFGGLAVLALIADPSAPRRLAPLAPYRWLAQQWRRGLGYKAWLIALALGLVGLIAFGAVSWIEVPAVHLSTIGRNIGKVVGLLPPALPFLVLLVQVSLLLANALAGARWLLVLASALLVGGYTAFGFMPGLSEHFSPREVYETYNDLARKDEPLVEYRVGARTAAYYAKGNAIEVDTLTALLAELDREQRRWVVFPADELASIDRLFRTRTGRHLFVADGRSAKVTLATNHPIAGRKDANAISQFVRREPPSKIQHPVNANFEDRVELLGYDLELPHGDHVGAGEQFHITWYFKVNKTVPGSYKIFVHIDESTMRIHGDHDPIDGRYPVRMWDVGDVIYDRQTVEVPTSYPAGDYTIYMGFYSGETRLDVKSGPMDDGDRVRAGVLRIR